jgi:segregation and condensation protein B
MDKILLNTIEAMIFASGEPVSVKRMAEVLELKPDAVEKGCEELRAQYDERDGGIKLCKLEDEYQFCSASQYGNYIRSLNDIKRNTPLSQAALEVLSIIAYNQPITKAFAEQVRGVDCSGVYNSLVEKGLIEEKGRLELPGRPILYGTTPLFLRSFGLTSLVDLPPLPKDIIQRDGAGSENISLESYISDVEKQDDEEID